MREIILLNYKAFLFICKNAEPALYTLAGILFFVFEVPVLLAEDKNAPHLMILGGIVLFIECCFTAVLLVGYFSAPLLSAEQSLKKV